MTRTFVAAVLAALSISPHAAQTAPLSRYKLQGPTKTASQPATKTQSPPAGQRPVLGPVAAPRPAPTKTDRNVRPAGDTQPIREPGAGQLPPRQPLRGAALPQQPRVDAAPQPPDWFPLNAEVQKWVDDVLVEWEATSSAVHNFECTFQRWEFEPIFGPKDGKTPKSYATGVIKYQDPDKGLFRVDSLKNYVAPAKVGDKPQFVTPKDEFGEHWVCDGKSIFEFDNRQKKLIERILPKEMQGKAIADGPLPFLFGAKAATINARYWIRPAPDKPQGAEDEYWLEAWPKSRQDAANFKFVKIIIAHKDFMPSALSVYMPNFDAKRNPARIDYKFESRKATEKGNPNIFKQMAFWEKEFFEPKIPFGWKKEVQNLNDPPVAAGPPAAQPQARKLKTGVKTK
jgi:TIGR03009 family protein